MAARALPFVNLALASSALGYGLASLRPRVQAVELKQDEAYFATPAALAHHAATADVRFAHLDARFSALLEHQNELDALRATSPATSELAPQPAAEAAAAPEPDLPAVAAAVGPQAPAVAPAVTIVDPHAIQAAFLAEEGMLTKSAESASAASAEPVAVAAVEAAPAPVVVEVAAAPAYPEEILVAERELEILKAALAAEKAKAT